VTSTIAMLSVPAFVPPPKRQTLRQILTGPMSRTAVGKRVGRPVTPGVRDVDRSARDVARGQAAEQHHSPTTDRNRRSILDRGLRISRSVFNQPKHLRRPNTTGHPREPFRRRMSVR
jgi:hypothetical protein